ncbi:ATP-dependent protease subunit HslV [Candidatus Cyrtobacter comes]|uniref:ATP-dependent protease subunit HslV n=1 Tax=Candidatus Cyrtobacter comes TaxID=675776 RepID=A0ABU5L8I1_9RICK|nr:ATP-dependent protease subunit HslV [Candidatus Cyrtobacter comes]MDZ5762418.1 ATP-dependent protease subunit HslV [Candidatus Cyrtobacter comes]
MLHSTTILSVKRNESIVIAGDGQVSFGNTIFKSNTNKIRKFFDGKVISGFAGSAADGMALFERLNMRLKKHSGNLLQAAVDMAKDWRSDKYLRRLEAMMIVADAQNTLILSGQGDVIEPEDGIAAIGSGGNYALSAAKALFYSTDMSAMDIVKKSMKIAADVCVYTNHNVVIEELNIIAKAS